MPTPDTPVSDPATATAEWQVRPLLVHVPPPTRGAVARSWLALTAWSLVACLVLFLIVPVAAAAGPGRLSPDAWRWMALAAAAVAGATALITTIMYVPQMIAWPRREQVLEITPDKIILVRIDPWRRSRRELPVAAVKQVDAFGSQVCASVGRRRATYVLLRWLSPAEAKRSATMVREALGLA